MAKGKDIRVIVILECTGCDKKSVNKESTGISRYITKKNRQNTDAILDTYMIHQEHQNTTNFKLQRT